MDLTQFPDDVMRLILSHASGSDLVQARSTCRRWRQLVSQSETLCKRIYMDLLFITDAPPLPTGRTYLNALHERWLLTHKVAPKCKPVAAHSWNRPAGIDRSNAIPRVARCGELILVRSGRDVLAFSPELAPAQVVPLAEEEWHGERFPLEMIAEQDRGNHFWIHFAAISDDTVLAINDLSCQAWRYVPSSPPQLRSIFGHWMDPGDSPDYAGDVVAFTEGTRLVVWSLSQNKQLLNVDTGRRFLVLTVLADRIIGCTWPNRPTSGEAPDNRLFSYDYGRPELRYETQLSKESLLGWTRSTTQYTELDTVGVLSSYSCETGRCLWQVNTNIRKGKVTDLADGVLELLDYDRERIEWRRCLNGTVVNSAQLTSLKDFCTEDAFVIRTGQSLVASNDIFFDTCWHLNLANVVDGKIIGHPTSFEDCATCAELNGWSLQHRVALAPNRVNYRQVELFDFAQQTPAIKSRILIRDAHSAELFTLPAHEQVGIVWSIHTDEHTARFPNGTTRFHIGLLTAANDKRVAEQGKCCVLC